MMRAVLLILAVITGCAAASAERSPSEAAYATGTTFSGFVGEVDPELTRLRLHFPLTDAQAKAVRDLISEHRSALEAMQARYFRSWLYFMDEVVKAGGFDEVDEANPDMREFRHAKHKDVQESQAALESRLIERIRTIIQPADDSIWQDYLMTRDFERWRQASTHESLGQTIDPLLLLHETAPEVVQAPEALPLLREIRTEVRARASALVAILQKQEQVDFRPFDFLGYADFDERAEFEAAIEEASFNLAQSIWRVPERLAESGIKGVDERAFHQFFCENQNIVQRLKPVPMEVRIGGPRFIRDALHLSGLSAEQRDELQSVLVEIEAAYSEALDIEYAFEDSWLRRPYSPERSVLPPEYFAIVRRISMGPDEIASLLTLPQWLELIHRDEAWGSELYHFHPDYETFDWSALDFKSLIPD
ncbi:MAG: hypothetical protein ABL309_09295 [Phycisphaerales bacterium]